MKSILIVYMPGHAGNFLGRLFSLSPETIPQLSFTALTESGYNKTFLDQDRLAEYSFKQVNSTYTNWQQFHRNFTDFFSANKIESLNQSLDAPFSKSIYQIHPYEFIKIEPNISNRAVELFHVELDLTKFNNWVEEARQELKFITRTGEGNLFLKITSKYNTQPISLTKMLTSETEFINEYNRVCVAMGITAVPDQALTLYQDWYSVRVNKTEHNNNNKKSFIKIHSRSTSDRFTFSIFNELLNKVTCDFEAYYSWTNPVENFISFIANTKFTKPNVIIGIKDLLDCGVLYDYWSKTPERGVALLKGMGDKHKDKKFIIFSSVENLDSELSTIPNIQVIPWGGDMTNQDILYPTIVPVLNKNFNSTKPYITLNRNYRHHRIILVSYLAAQGYLPYGQVSFLSPVPDDMLSVMPWEFDMSRHTEIRNKILTGYTNHIHNNNSLLLDKYEQVYTRIGSLTDNDNFKNFNQYLRSKYENSFVEIVTESSFESPTFMITEKFLNSVYGCNFPILLSGVGAISHLREVGFDMFDDIVDHSYDSIDNPFDRIIAAVDLNKRLLTDTEYTKQVWQSNQQRFEKNIEFAKTSMYKWFKSRATNLFNTIKWA